MTQSSKDAEDQQVALPADKQLYPRLMANDNEAWRSFDDCYRARLRGYFNNHHVSTVEDREDLVQETFIIFSSTLLSEKYQPQQGTLAQWLYGVAGKILIKHRKRYAEEYSKQDELRDDHVAHDDEAVSTSISAVDKDRLTTALAQLSDKVRAVILLRTQRSSEWTWKDIARELEITESAAKMRYQRGIDELKRLLS